MNLNNFIDLNLNSDSGILKWSREWDGTNGSFVTPPCFSLESFLKKMHETKGDCSIADISTKNGITKATVINSYSGEIVYFYELVFTEIKGNLQ